MRAYQDRSCVTRDLRASFAERMDSELTRVRDARSFAGGRPSEDGMDCELGASRHLTQP